MTASPGSQKAISTLFMVMADICHAACGHLPEQMVPLPGVCGGEHQQRGGSWQELC